MEQELILAVAIGVIFLVIKLTTIRLNTKITDKSEQNRTVFRDSIMIVFISAIAMYAKKEFFSKTGGKTPVFTNEPGF